MLLHGAGQFAVLAAGGAAVGELARLYDDGTISQPARQRLQRGLDLEAARLSNEQH